MADQLSDRDRMMALRRSGAEHQAMQGFLRSLQPKTIQSLFREMASIRVPVEQEVTQEGRATLDLTKMLGQAAEILKQAEKLEKQQPGRQNLAAERASQVAHSVSAAMFLRMLRGELQPTKTAQQLINAGVAQQFQSQVPVPALRAQPVTGPVRTF